MFTSKVKSRKDLEVPFGLGNTGEQFCTAVSSKAHGSVHSELAMGMRKCFTHGVRL